MAKIIIEVSDSYIRERANLDNIIQNSKDDVAKGMIELMAFSNIEKRIDNGENEFVIRTCDFKNAEETPRNALNLLMSQAAAVLLLNEVVLEKNK